MAPETGDRSGVLEVYRYIRVNDVAAANLLIVKKDIFEEFLSSLPSSSLKEFMAYAADRPPAVDDPGFCAWACICQSALGLTQEQFADALTGTGLVSVSQSNVSWIRRDLYKAGLSREKLENVRTAAEVLLREHRKKTKTPAP